MFRNVARAGLAACFILASQHVAAAETAKSWCVVASVNTDLARRTAQDHFYRSVLRMLVDNDIRYSDLHVLDDVITLKTVSPLDTAKVSQGLRQIATYNETILPLADDGDGRLKIRMRPGFFWPDEIDAAAGAQFGKIAGSRGAPVPKIVALTEHRIRLEFQNLPDPSILRWNAQASPLSIRLVNDEVSHLDPSVAPPPGSEWLPSIGMREGPLIVVKRPLMSGDRLIQMRATEDQYGRPAISFQFDDEGAAQFAEITRTNIGRSVAIVLDGKVLSAPRVMTPITSGEGVISGDFSTETIAALLKRVNARELPPHTRILSQGPCTTP